MYQRLVNITLLISVILITDNHVLLLNVEKACIEFTVTP